MACQRSVEISLVDSATIIADPNHAGATGFNFYGDRTVARVETVLYQFLDHRSRPLNHFSGGNLVDQVRW